MTRKPGKHLRPVNHFEKILKQLMCLGCKNLLGILAPRVPVMGAHTSVEQAVSPRTRTVQFSSGHHFDAVSIALDGQSGSDEAPLFHLRSM